MRTDDAPGPFVYAVGREKIREFALAVGETHPWHHDVDAAREAGFRDLVAPVMFVSVYAGPIFRQAMWVPSLGVQRQMTVHGSQEFRWELPVIAGDELTSVAELASIDTSGRHRYLVFETVTHNQDDAVVVRGTWTVIERDAGGGEAASGV